LQRRKRRHGWCWCRLSCRGEGFGRIVRLLMLDARQILLCFLLLARERAQEQERAGFLRHKGVWGHH
jgi:hypothetical protein